MYFIETGKLDGQTIVDVEVNTAPKFRRKNLHCDCGGTQLKVTLEDWVFSTKVEDWVFPGESRAFWWCCSCRKLSARKVK